MKKKIFNFLNNFKKNKKGNLILFSTVFGLISFSVVVTAVYSYAFGEHRSAMHQYNREMAFQIAEAGLNYYRWHLAHDLEDFQDGTGQPGPYVHEYKDKQGSIIGYFSLEITPPIFGTSVVEIKSTGWLANYPANKRILKMRLGFKSITDYSLLSDADIWIGSDEKTYGKFHSNYGIRYDGLGNAPITSAVPSYTCRSYHGCSSKGETKDGIWGIGEPKDLWNFPVPATDFAGITINLANIRTEAKKNGIYLTASNYRNGYSLKFLSNGKLEVKKVLTLDCFDGQDVNSNQIKKFCIDTKAKENKATTYTLADNTYIFIEDNVWVEGVVKGRVTLGTTKSIMIPDNLTYYSKDGNHVLGLIATNDILLPYKSPEDLEINAAMLAQNGATKRYFYSKNIKNSLLIYGSIITKGIWTWSWVSGGDTTTITSGYKDVLMVYDENLTFGPPSGFPIGTEYKILSWDIVK